MMFVFILQDKINLECICILKYVMDTDILRSGAEGRSSIINYIYFRPTRETVFFSNKRVSAGHERAATHVPVVCRYVAMILSARGGDDTGFLSANNQPGTLMIRNSGCHLRKNKSNDKYVNFMVLSVVSGKVGHWAENLTSVPFSLRLTHTTSITSLYYYY